MTAPRSRCTVEGCDAPHQARGWCQKHYRRFVRHGSTDVVGSKRVVDPARAAFLRSRGWLNRDIADLYGVTPQAISKAVAGVRA